MKGKVSFLVAGIIATLLLSSCGGGGSVSPTTGWTYNNSKNGGFEVNTTYLDQEAGPGMVLVEGGAFTMGKLEQDVMFDWNNMPRQVTVPSFYMDETEVRNVDYKEYLHWLGRVFIDDLPKVYYNALPDTLVWRRRLAYNEPMVDYYFRHPAYDQYPVVGINWLQAVDYCIWRSDRVNEQILINNGLLKVNPAQRGADNFNTEAYLAGRYVGETGKLKPSLDPDDDDGRPVKMEDGMLLPNYRLPTEAEWEYAALGIISYEERISERRLYPWSGHYVRNPESADMGSMMANFKRGRGDLMGVAGSLNDNAAITTKVDAFWPNDFGLYCMAGNVNEWVLDVYRPMSHLDVEDYRPFRGNTFTKRIMDDTGQPELDTMGRIKKEPIKFKDALGRNNYSRADNINYSDGDVKSSHTSGTDWVVEGEEDPGSERMYNSGKTERMLNATSLINDKVRVYKGGGWRDRVYWMVPGTRRYLDERKSTDDIGFRCAMTRVGDSTRF
ncbi:MAG TPA: gliding motility lipoprotein GldJ [Bacteroidales bacterium]|nr:gliding motility lipoprotein GldJ [Bacteroidales bacterium]